MGRSLFIDLEHIGVKAYDIEKALTFYTDILGFEFVTRYKPRDNELVFIKLGVTVVELIEVSDNTKYEDGVVNHIALRVSDIFKAVNWLKENDVELINDAPMDLGEGRLNFFFRGPSGEKIELYQVR